VTRAAAREPRQLMRDIVVARLGLQALGDRNLRVVGRGFDQGIGHAGRWNPRRAIEDEGGSDVRLVEEQLGLQELELEADRPQVLAQQELRVLERELVGLAFRLRGRRDMAGGVRIDLRGRENALWRDSIGHMEPRLASIGYSVTPARRRRDN